MFILEKTGVASVPGEAFFHKPVPSQFVCFYFAKEEGELKKNRNSVISIITV